MVFWLVLAQYLKQYIVPGPYKKVLKEEEISFKDWHPSRREVVFQDNDVFC